LFLKLQANPVGDDTSGHPGSTSW